MDFPHIEQTTRRFLDSIKGGKPLYELSIHDARKVLDTLQEQSHAKKPAVHVEDAVFPCGPSGKVSVRIVRPASHEPRVAAIVYFHGGGWILGNKGTHDRLISELADQTKAAVVFVNFTPSPEAHFPTAIEEGFAVVKYLSEHGNRMNLESHRLAVAGDSVGGNMAAVVAILAKESGIALRFQALFYPVTDADFNTPSYKEFANGPWLTKPAMEWFWDAYAPNPTDRKNWKVSPLHASPEQLRNLPPALVFTDENDVLRDEGEAYARKLIQAGVKVTAVRFLGTIHDFMLLNPLAETPAARSAISLASSLLHGALRN